MDRSACVRRGRPPAACTAAFHTWRASWSYQEWHHPPKEGRREALGFGILSSAAHSVSPPAPSPSHETREMNPISKK